uniref:Uncharacterized protein n=1 Tax=Setaria italica TaxID=4555 RepID=K4A155_SETIT
MLCCWFARLLLDWLLPCKIRKPSHHNFLKVLGRNNAASSLCLIEMYNCLLSF